MNPALSTAGPFVAPVNGVVPILPRGKPGESGAWCWQSKEALRHINTSIDVKEEKASARSVYIALTQISSDRQSEVFTTTVSAIEDVSGVHDRTVRKRLHDLEKMGLIQIKKTALKAPSVYTLLAFGNNARAFGNNARAFGNGAVHHRMPTLEEEDRRDEKNSPKAPKGAGAVVDDEVAEGIYGLYPRKTKDRRKALNAIIATLTKVDADTLRGAVTRFAKKPGLDRENGRFIPSAVNWFQDECWKDYLPKPAAAVVHIPRPSKALDDLRWIFGRKTMGHFDDQERALLDRYMADLTPEDLTFLTPHEKTRIESMKATGTSSGPTTTPAMVNSSGASPNPQPIEERNGDNGVTSTRARDPVDATQIAATATPSPALEDFRRILASGRFRAPNEIVVARRVIAKLTPEDYTLLTPEEKGKHKTLTLRR